METARSIQILGVNAVGHESGNATVTSGRDLPWLQDDEQHGVYQSWSPTYRDVVVLDGDNRVVGAYNLTDNDLGDASNYAALRQMLLDAAND